VLETSICKIILPRSRLRIIYKIVTVLTFKTFFWNCHRFDTVEFIFLAVAHLLRFGMGAGYLSKFFCNNECPAMTFTHLDTLDSTSTMLQSRIIGEEHYETTSASIIVFILSHLHIY